MDIRRLEVFCKVVDLRSFTGAAHDLSLSQPTVSEHIRILEEGLGVRLIERLGRKALPTEAGRILYRYGRRIVALRDEAAQAIQRYSGSLAGRLTVGASTIPGTYLIPELVASFKLANPEIQVALTIAGSRDIAEAVLEARIEVGFVGARFAEPGLVWKEAFTDELVLAVRPDHPWAGQKSVPAALLKTQPFILRERRSGTRSFTAEVLERAGLNLDDLNAVAEMGSTEAVRQSVKAGIGASILSLRAVSDDIARGDVVSVPIRGMRFRRPIYLVRRKKQEPSPICAAFLEHVNSREARPRRT